MADQAGAPRSADQRGRRGSLAVCPTGVFGRLPTGSTVTTAGRTPIAAVTAERTSAAIRSASASSPACRDSTASANDSRPPGVCPAHRHRVAGPHALDGLGDPLDVGRIDVAAAHDDHVLDPAADHHLAVDQVAEIAGVQPAVGALGGHRVRPPSGSGRSPHSPRRCSTPTSRSATARRPHRRRRPRSRAAADPAPGRSWFHAVRRRLRSHPGRRSTGTARVARAPAPSPARCPPSTASPTDGTTPPASPRPSRRRRPLRSSADRTGRRHPGTPAPR